MKSLIVLTFALAMASAQLPYYAQNAVNRITVASRFKDDSTPSTTPSLGSRLGEDGGTTPKIPIDARGDLNLVNRLNEWPREHRPFWLLNADAIEKQRNTQTAQAPVQSQNTVNPIENRSQLDSKVTYDDFGNIVRTTRNV